MHIMACMSLSVWMGPKIAVLSTSCPLYKLAHHQHQFVHLVPPYRSPFVSWKVILVSWKCLRFCWLRRDRPHAARRKYIPSEKVSGLTAGTIDMSHMHPVWKLSLAGSGAGTARARLIRVFWFCSKNAPTQNIRVKITIMTEVEEKFAYCCLSNTNKQSKNFRKKKKQIICVVYNRQAHTLLAVISADQMTSYR